MAPKKTKVAPVPRGFRTVTPHLTAANVEQAVGMYQAALGAELVSSQTFPDADGIIFALIKIGNSQLTIGQGVTSGAGSVGLHLYVNDATGTWDNAVEAGFTVVDPLQKRYWGDLTGLLRDPLGVNWSLGQRVEKLSVEEQQDRARRTLETDAEHDN